MKFSKTQLTFLVVLRIFIGWHFLYEGITKVINPNWTSMGYLLDSGGPFKGLFTWMAGNPGLVQVVDFLNVWGLVAIGLGLILGLLTRYALFGGIVLLAFYYLSHPPLVGVTYAMPSEGSYLLINKTLIEMAAMFVLLYFPTWRDFGIDGLICGKSNRRAI